MLPLIWIIGLALGIALLFAAAITERVGALWSGTILTIVFSVFMMIWISLYAESCMTVADLKAFSEVQSINYRAMAGESKEAIDWSKVSDSEWYVQSTIFGEYALALGAFIDEIYHYNQELSRLRDFNENPWLDLIFRDVPPDLEYFVLRTLPETEG